jgi:hypothetical protein
VKRRGIEQKGEKGEIGEQMEREKTGSRIKLRFSGKTEGSILGLKTGKTWKTWNGV